MMIYREFETEEKNMQETMIVIIIRYIIENSCNLFQTELKSTHLGINNSIIS